jgi:PKD repeat protein
MKKGALNSVLGVVLRTVLVFSGLLMASSAQGAILPADRQFQWQGNVGVEGGIPNSSNMVVYTTVPAGASVATINSAIAACPSNQVVQLAAGTYNLSGIISMNTGVVLRGAGMSNSILTFTSGGIYAGTLAFYNAVRSAQYSGGGSANWTAGYAQGTSNLTFSTTSPGLTVGNIVYLDQANDTFYVNNVGYEGSVGGVRGNNVMCQFTKVTAVNGNTVTIWPPIAATWFTGVLGPGAVWIGASAWKSRIGIENMTLDGTASTGVGAYHGNVHMEGVHDCWVKGIKSLYGAQNHVFFGYGSYRCELRDSYLYGTQNASSQSYGLTLDWVSGFLCENNVFERLVGAVVPHMATSCNVFGYNYFTNEWYISANNFLMAGIQPHNPHCYMELFEGNHVPKYDGDFIHGSHSHEVLFRNRITGWEAYSYPSGPTVNNLQCEFIDITNRYCSSVGNILGTVGIYNKYQSAPLGGTFGQNGVIYQIGLVNPVYGFGWPNDTNTWNTFFRHMDYDVVTGGITYNPTNADVTLPPSLYYTSKPPWWGNLTWPPFNPTNTTAAAIDPTNIPAGYWRVYGHYPPAGVINQPPVANASATPINGLAPLVVSFSSAGSSDPGGATLTYSWAFGDGGTSTSANPSYTYQNAGTYTAQLSVSDGNNTTPSSPLTITVTSNPAPVISMTSPANGASYAAPATIGLAASVTPNGHTITKVQFYNGATLLGEDTTAPYTLSWSNVGAGSYSLIARAVYDAGVTTDSAAVTVTVGGLVAAYSFGEGSGATTADASGKGNTGTISGASWNASGRFGSSLSFNGSNSLVTISDSASLDLTQGLTLEAWVFPTALGGWRSILFKPHGTQLCYVLQGSSNPSGVPSLGLSVAPSNVMAPNPLPLNTWSHIAGTYDGVAMTFYVNGVQVASQSQTGTLATSTDALTIGGDTAGDDWSGLIDEVRIYNRALSAAEIQADMNTPIPASPAAPTGLHVVGY